MVFSDSISSFIHEWKCDKWEPDSHDFVKQNEGCVDKCMVKIHTSCDFLPSYSNKLLCYWVLALVNCLPSPLSFLNPSQVVLSPKKLPWITLSCSTDCRQVWGRKEREGNMALKLGPYYRDTGKDGSHFFPFSRHLSSLKKISTSTVTSCGRHERRVPRQWAFL